MDNSNAIDYQFFVQKLHPDVFLKYEVDKKSYKRPIHKDVDEECSSHPSKIPKQSFQTTMTMFSNTNKNVGPAVCSNSIVEKKVLALVADGLLPLNVVEL